MPKRTVIEIDRDKCIGCAQCVNACHQGALAMVDGKAKLVGEIKCDGLGACIGDCPVGALKLIQKEVSVAETGKAVGAAKKTFSGCPGTKVDQFKAQIPDSDNKTQEFSALSHWPIQLKLVNPTMGVFDGADVLIAADCTAFSMGTFHKHLLDGKKLIIACPKLDDNQGYVEKIAEMVKFAKPASITVARMEVPCCRGLSAFVKEGISLGGGGVEYNEVVISIQGGKIL